MHFLSPILRFTFFRSCLSSNSRAKLSSSRASLRYFFHNGKEADRERTTSKRMCKRKLCVRSAIASGRKTKIESENTSEINLPKKVYLFSVCTLQWFSNQFFRDDQPVNHWSSADDEYHHLQMIMGDWEGIKREKNEFCSIKGLFSLRFSLLGRKSPGSSFFQQPWFP